MPADKRILEWTEDKTMEQIQHFKAIIVIWECAGTEEGTCKFKYTYAIERRLKRCKRDLGNLNGSAGKWFWGAVTALAVLGAAVATIASGGLFLGIAAAGWGLIAGFSGVMTALSTAGEAFNEKYRDCDDLPTPAPENESDELEGTADSCDAFCAQRLAELWAKIGKKD
jgi:hypothetical protein